MFKFATLFSMWRQCFGWAVVNTIEDCCPPLFREKPRRESQKRFIMYKHIKERLRKVDASVVLWLQLLIALLSFILDLVSQ